MSIAITTERILKLCPSADRPIATALAPALNQGALNAGVTSNLRVAHFMGQMAHESGGFRRLVENLNYSSQRICEIWHRLCPRAQSLAHNQTALGNAAYADKNGNGNEESGDGFLFRGRGIVQLTGRGNYRAVGQWVGLDLEAMPELAALPANAAAIAFAFWTHANCNHFADMDDVRAVTKAINGGENGLTDRAQLTAAAKGIFT